MKKIFFWESPTYLLADDTTYDLYDMSNHFGVKILCASISGDKITDFMDFCDVNTENRHPDDNGFIRSTFQKLFYNNSIEEDKIIDFFEKLYTFYKADAWVINFALETYNIKNDMHMLSFVDFLLNKKSVSPNFILIVGDSTAEYSKSHVVLRMKEINKDFSIDNIYLSSYRSYSLDDSTLFNKVLALIGLRSD